MQAERIANIIKMLCVSCAYSRESTWLQALKVRTFFPRPVSRANLGTRKSGMKLHICRSRFRLEGAGTGLFFFFIPAVWQGQTFSSSFFFNFLWDASGLESKL